MKRVISMLMLVVPLSIAACGTGDREGENGAPEERTPEVPTTEGMQGMEGMSADDGMMERMAAHLRTLQGMSGDSLQSTLPTHRQMVANMIASMNREMRDMGMRGDDAWNAMLDSLRNDLVVMPDMNAGELDSFMPEHRRRIAGLMDMHRKMMKEMDM